MRNAIFLFLTFCAQLVLSQDLIVTNAGDSLNCLITRNENSYMYFNQIANHRFKRDSLALVNIRSFKVDYFTTKKEIKPATTPKPVTIQPYQTVKHQPLPSKIYKKENKFYISVNAGLGLRLKNPSEEYGTQFKEYYQKLYRGTTLGAEAAYFINENIGLGFQFSSYRSKQETPGAVDTSQSGNGVYTYGIFSNDVSILYFGPTFYYRTSSQNEKSIFIAHGSIGSTIYSNKINMIVFQYKESGNSLSLSIGGTYQYMIDRNIAIGASASYHIAIIPQLTYDDGIEKFTSSLFPEDVSRIDLKLLLAYYF